MSEIDKAEAMKDPHVADAVYTYKTVVVPLLDTGIGKAFGYEDDDDMREKIAAERAKLDPEVQEALNDFDAMYRRHLFYGG